MSQRRGDRSIDNCDILDFVLNPAGVGGERLVESTLIGNTRERSSIDPQSFHDYEGG